MTAAWSPRILAAALVLLEFARALLPSSYRSAPPCPGGLNVSDGFEKLSGVM